MAILDVWVAQPGGACRVDGNAWTITIYDAHQNVFERGGTTYADLPAPKAHWADKMPPGTYVVQGRRVDGTLTTDHAIVVVDCTTTACVHLYVAAPHGKPTGKCTITVDEVEGLSPGSDAAAARRIKVSGTAGGCSSLQVEVSCSGDSGTATAPVAVDGSWSAVVQFQGHGCQCGHPVDVLVTCADDPKCRVKETVKSLRCADQPTTQGG